MYKGKQTKFKHSFGNQSKKPVETTLTSDIVEHLRVCAHELEEKQDRCERILKIGRDITIDSKRLIFYLHNFQK